MEPKRGHVPTMSDGPEFESRSDERTGMPRWLRLTLIIIGIVIVVVVIVLAIGGGHGPSRHMGGVGAGTTVAGSSSPGGLR